MTTRTETDSIGAIEVLISFADVAFRDRDWRCDHEFNEITRTFAEIDSTGRHRFRFGRINSLLEQGQIRLFF